MDANAASRHHRNLISKPAKLIEQGLRRAKTQVDFARGFLEIHPEFESAVSLAEQIFEEGPSSPTNVNEWVSKIESALGPVSKTAKSYTVHCVGHGHIDMNWMWSWPETVSTTHDTFASILSFMDQYPTFTYSQSQASVYELIEEHYPAMFERIKQRVKEGRWEVAAVHWVEGDKNLASGESLARHMLYTRKYFLDKFGLKPEDVQVDWEPDTFGHANTIPNILAQGGVKYYYSCRQGGGHGHLRHEDPRPPVFWWKGTDGSKILVNRETTWYNSYINIGENFALAIIPFVKETKLNDWLNVYGVGNHGGGPTRDEIEWISEAAEFPCYPTVLFSTSTKYFKAIEAQINSGTDVPVLNHELNFEFTGCYTSQSAIKKANRFGENYGIEAETLAAIGIKSLGLDADKAGISKSTIQKAWLPTLFNQFHDILPGSGVPETRSFALGLFQGVGATTGAIKRTVVGEIASRVNSIALLPKSPEAQDELELIKSGKSNTPYQAGAGIGSSTSGFSAAVGGGRKFFPFVVYNPCAWERSEMVEVSLYDHSLDINRVVVVDETGRKYPTIMTYAGNGNDWGHKRQAIAFPAVDVPALGYKTFLVYEDAADSFDDIAIKFEDELTVQTPYLRTVFDRYQSGPTSLIPTATDDELCPGLEGLGCWTFVREISRGMTSWVIGGEIERTTLPATRFHLGGATRNQGNGAASGTGIGALVYQKMEVPGTKSSVVLKSLIHGLAPRLDFEAEIDWREIGDDEEGIPGLVVDFETTLGLGSESTLTFETPFGSVVREPLPDDVPALRYVSVAEDGRAITLLQDSKYGFRGNDGGFEMRVVRSSYDPDHAPEVAKSTLRYSLYIHETEPTTAELARLGAAFNHRFIVAPATLQSGDLPLSKSYVSVENEDVVLTSLKEAESEGVVIRLVNYANKVRKAEITLDWAISSAELVDLNEVPLGFSLKSTNKTFAVDIPANSFVSVLVK